MSGGPCTACPLNTYSTSLGSPSCTNCPTGSVTTTTGATSPAQCLCQAGYYNATNGACTMCPAGTFKSSVGNFGCESTCSVPAGKGPSLASANDTCIFCAPGLRGLCSLPRRHVQQRRRHLLPK